MRKKKYTNFSGKENQQQQQSKITKNKTLRNQYQIIKLCGNTEDENKTKIQKISAQNAV